MSVDNSNPDTHLERLHNIIREIPSGVREEDFESILKVQQSQELLKTTNDNIICTSKQWLDNVWKNCNVTKKLEELPMVTEYSNVSWRPTTGEVDVKPLMMNVLRERKNKLEQDIKSLRHQSLALRSYLINCSETFNRQINKMNISDTSLIKENKKSMKECGN